MSRENVARRHLRAALQTLFQFMRDGKNVDCRLQFLFACSDEIDREGSKRLGAFQGLTYQRLFIRSCNTNKFQNVRQVVLGYRVSYSSRFN